MNVYARYNVMFWFGIALFFIGLAMQLWASSHWCET